MTANPILQELYAARAQIMANYGDDLGAYLRDAAERTRVSGHPIANIKQRTIRCTGAAKSGVVAMKSQSSPPGDR
ncbi:MAG: hypothetical protein WBF93_12470 [Pirellulales bacterium]